MTYYDMLGLHRESSKSDIRKAYLKLAKDHHPDAHPNDPQAAEKFAKIQEAYDCLRDPERRAYYDRNGKGMKQVPEQEDINRFIILCFEEMVSQHGLVDRADPFEMIRFNLGKKLLVERRRIPAAQQEIEFQLRLKGRLKYKGKGKNPIEKVFDDKVKAQEDIIHNAGVAIDLIEETQKQLVNFGWEANPDPAYREGSLRLPGSGRPRTPEEIGRLRGPTQDELQKIHHGSGRGF